LYITGESYAGKVYPHYSTLYLYLRYSINSTAIHDGSYFTQSVIGKHVPGLAYKIHQENQNSGQIKINLKGFAIGNGFSDPFNQIGYGEVLYNFGLIDKNERRYFEKKQDLIKAYIALQRWGDATDVSHQSYEY
jgi:carboxypeptidase C (cathepsin A)